MIRYFRIKELFALTISLIAEAVFAVILFGLVIGFAKHYHESHHSTIIAIFAAILGSIHAFSTTFAIIGLSNIRRKKDSNGYVVVDFRKQAYWNAILAGYLIYPIFVADYAWKKSGYSKKELYDATVNYIKKHIDIILDSEVFKKKMSSQTKQEVKNIKELQKENFLTKIEGNEYLYDIFFKEGVVTDHIIGKLTENYIDQIIEFEL